MSMILSKEAFGQYLDIVEKALSRQSPIQYLDNIFCETDPEKITLAATNLELFIKVALPYKGEASGKILLPSKIAEIVRYLPESEVDFEIDIENLQVNLSCGPSKFTLAGADPADFPPLEKIVPENNTSISIDPQELKKTLKMVIFAASAEETRPAFNGVLFEFDCTRLTLMSSDTYRLAVKDISDGKWNFPNRRCLVPAKALRELLKIIEQSEKEIEFFSGGEQLIFNFGTVYFAARLLNEKYPDISSVIPERYLTRVKTNRSSMAETVARAALLAEGPNSAIQLSVGSGSMVVRVSSQIGRMEEELSVDCQGEEVELHINSRFIMDFLRAVSTEEITIDFHGKTGPVIFRLPGDESYLYLVLPIKMDY